MARIVKLPAPDEHGNYWLGNGVDGPAVFPMKVKRLRKDGIVEVRATGFYTATLGLERGFLLDGVKRRLFKSAALALEALNMESSACQPPRQSGVNVTSQRG